MARVKRGVTAHARPHKIPDMARGYRGRPQSSFRTALHPLEKAPQYPPPDTPPRPPQLPSPPPPGINAGCRQHGLTYSQFMNGLARAGIELDRKILSDLAVREPDTFKVLVERAGAALAKTA